ncbi:MAG: GH39 family glycosyl hydrolase, partial [Mycobacterium sp.]
MGEDHHRRVALARLGQPQRHPVGVHEPHCAHRLSQAQAGGPASSSVRSPSARLPGTAGRWSSGNLDEPENQPACWTGTDDEYFNLYRVASRLLKERFPSLKIGGPAIGGTGQVKNGKFEPSGFLTRFLQLCQQEHLPLDFFSWHCYT